MPKAKNAKPKHNYRTEAGESNPRDRCQSPSYAVQPIVGHLSRFRDELGRAPIIWESAAGEGLLVEALKLHGFDQVIATELLDGVDYFAYEPQAYDLQITNVPFSRKYDWLKRAYELGKPFMLLSPGDLLFNKTSIEMFEHYGNETIVPYPRIDFKMINAGWDGAGAQMNTSWFCWQMKIGKALSYFRLDKPKRQRVKEKNGIVLLETPEYPQEALFA